MPAIDGSPFAKFRIRLIYERLARRERSETVSGNDRNGSVAERLRLWSDDLFAEALPEQDIAGTPVLLACDDETIRIPTSGRRQTDQLPVAFGY